MKRNISRWVKCDPDAMAREMSVGARAYAFEDAKSDILELHRDNVRLRDILRQIAYPKRGTSEESASLQNFADLIQQTYTIEQLEA